MSWWPNRRQNLSSRRLTIGSIEKSVQPVNHKTIVQKADAFWLVVGAAFGVVVYSFTVGISGLFRRSPLRWLSKQMAAGRVIGPVNVVIVPLVLDLLLSRPTDMVGRLFQSAAPLFNFDTESFAEKSSVLPWLGAIVFFVLAMIMVSVAFCVEWRFRRYEGLHIWVAYVTAYLDLMLIGSRWTEKTAAESLVVAIGGGLIYAAPLIWGVGLIVWDRLEKIHIILRAIVSPLLGLVVGFSALWLFLNVMVSIGIPIDDFFAQKIADRENNPFATAGVTCAIVSEGEARRAQCRAVAINARERSQIVLEPFFIENLAINSSVTSETVLKEEFLDGKLDREAQSPFHVKSGESFAINFTIPDIDRACAFYLNKETGPVTRFSAVFESQIEFIQAPYLAGRRAESDFTKLKWEFNFSKLRTACRFPKYQF